MRFSIWQPKDTKRELTCEHAHTHTHTTQDFSALAIINEAQHLRLAFTENQNTCGGGNRLHTGESTEA